MSSDKLPKNMLGFLEREIDRPHRQGDKDYRSYRPAQTITSSTSTSTSKPKLVGADKLSNLSERLEKAINRIVGSATVATKKKTPPVKPKKKTPPKKKAPTKSGGGVGGFGKFSTINRARNKKVDLNKPFDV